MNLFELNKINTETVQIHFESNKELVLTFRDSLGARKEILYGKFKNRGFFEIYLRKHILEIPPFFPIIYGNRDIKRLRIALTKESELVIENKWTRNSNLFIFASGGSGRLRNYFKIVTPCQ